MEEPGRIRRGEIGLGGMVSAPSSATSAEELAESSQSGFDIRDDCMARALCPVTSIILRRDLRSRLVSSRLRKSVAASIVAKTASQIVRTPVSLASVMGPPRCHEDGTTWGCQ